MLSSCLPRTVTRTQVPLGCNRFKIHFLREHISKHKIVCRIVWSKSGKVKSLDGAAAKKVKYYTCPKCRYRTDRKNNLKRHMLTMHEKCSKVLECCNIIFSNKSALKEHVSERHLGAGYACLVCNRRFGRKALMKRHSAVHSGQRQYNCSECDYATSHKSNLDRHIRRHQQHQQQQQLLKHQLQQRTLANCDKIKSAIHQMNPSAFYDVQFLRGGGGGRTPYALPFDTASTGFPASGFTSITDGAWFPGCDPLYSSQLERRIGLELIGSNQDRDWSNRIKPDRNWSNRI